MKKKILCIFIITLLCLFTFNIKVSAVTTNNQITNESNNVRFIDQKDYNKIGINVEEDAQTEEDCEELFGNTFFQYLNDTVFKIIWIGVPLLLILLTSWDFAKVVFTSDKDGMKNAFDRFKKRAIVSILIFLTPTIIIVIAKLIDPNDTVTVQDCVRKIRDMNKSYIVVNTDLLK